MINFQPNPTEVISIVRPRDAKADPRARTSISSVPASGATRAFRSPTS